MRLHAASAMAAVLSRASTMARETVSKTSHGYWQTSVPWWLLAREGFTLLLLGLLYSCSQNGSSSLPKWPRWKARASITYSLKWHAITAVIIGHTDQLWDHVREDYTRAWIIGGGDHWGLPWKLVTPKLIKTIFFLMMSGDQKSILTYCLDIKVSY